MRTPLVVSLAGLALVAVSVTACQSKSTAAAPSSASATATATTGGGSTPSAAGSVTSAPTDTPVAATGKLNGVPAACPSVAEVMSNLSLSKLQLESADPALCEYLYNGSVTAPYVAIAFSAAPGMTTTAFAAGVRAGQKRVAAVSGLADAAYTFTGEDGSTGLSILSGTTVFTILTTVTTTTDGKVALARSIIGG